MLGKLGIFSKLNFPNSRFFHFYYAVIGLAPGREQGSFVEQIYKLGTIREPIISFIPVYNAVLTSKLDDVFWDDLIQIF
jgi:hypothetical protein